MGAQHNEWYAARSMVALADGSDVVEMDDVLMALLAVFETAIMAPALPRPPSVYPRHTALQRCATTARLRKRPRS